jgi:hypothetical protein
MPTWLSSLAAKVLAQLIVRKVELLLVLLSPALSGVLLYLHTEIAPHLSDPTGWLTLKAIALSVALFPLPFAAYFWFRPKLKHVPELDIHKDTKTGAYFCSRCYLKENKYAPLSIAHHGWRCSRHGEWFQDPNNPVVPIPTVHHWNEKP